MNIKFFYYKTKDKMYTYRARIKFWSTIIGLVASLIGLVTTFLQFYKISTGTNENTVIIIEQKSDGDISNIDERENIDIDELN